jgi:hypothetical protein
MEQTEATPSGIVSPPGPAGPPAVTGVQARMACGAPEFRFGYDLLVYRRDHPDIGRAGLP